MIKAVIYDLDDTLIDSIGIHIKANNEVFSDYIKEDLPAELRQRFVGMRVIDIITETINYFDLKLDPKEIYEKRSLIFFDLLLNRLELMPGAINSLDLVKDGGLLIALATSGNQKYVDIVLDKFTLSSYFDVIVTGDDVKKGKPDPETFLVTVERLRLNPAECLVLEDATSGIKSAKDAGCKCIAVKNKHTPSQDLSKADKVLDSLEELRIDILAKSFTI